jgi:hypothetical protein
VRESARIVTVAVIVAVCVNGDGRREVLAWTLDLKPNVLGRVLAQARPAAACAASSW